MNPLKQFESNERKMADVTHGTWGVCAVCYNLSLITKHHVIPRAAFKQKDWQPFSVMICKLCHSAVHQIADVNTLAKSHTSLSEVVQAIRKARNITEAR